MHSILRAALILAIVPLQLVAQDGADTARTPARITVPVRSLGRVVTSDSTILMDVSSVRHLPRGGVIVNDTRKRQLVVFDSALAKARVISDTSSNSPNPYGLRVTGGSLIPYRGDSTLFMDLESSAFLVIDEHGEFARVMAPVRASDLFYMGSAVGAASFDPQGRLLYRSVRRSPLMSPSLSTTSSERRQVQSQPDSAPIMRMDFDRRTVDTIGMMKIAVQKTVLVSTQNMAMAMPLINPLPQTDEWTQLPDGRIAIVRGHDYHVDFMTPDGKISSAPRLPFDWKRITHEEKVAIIDSLKKQEAQRLARMPAPPPPAPGQPMIPVYRLDPVDPDDLPDFYPAVRQGQVRVDPAGRIWILPATSKDAKEGLLYDIVNGEGRLEERVQLPKGRTLIGFGPDGMLYLNHVRSFGKSTLERAWVAR
ncbi:MAG: hypothetical protein IBJ03_06930 [Gemmatimonadaceae bacterium]|nr:hypothetical protein [Gemmatimonadaceae bacterium]